MTRRRGLVLVVAIANILPGIVPPHGRATMDSSLPTVRWVSPPAGTAFAVQKVAAEAEDDSGIARVDFVVDGSVIGGAGTAPYQFAWTTIGVSDGSYAVTARALANDGGVAETEAVTILVGNGLTADQRLDADFAAGRVTVDDYALYGVYAYVAPSLLPERYRSPTPTSDGTTGIVRFLRKWDELAPGTRASISAFLDLPPLHLPVTVPGEPIVIAASPSGITDPCTFVEAGALGINLGTKYECVHETTHFTIAYELEGTGIYEGNSTSAAPDDLGQNTFVACVDPISDTNCNGVPDYIDKIAQGLEEAHGIYVTDLGYPVNWDGTVPVRIRGGIEGGQVIPNPGGLETIDIELNDGTSAGAPYYLAHHELFHVFQYQYNLDASLLVNLGTDIGPWWWVEATADWAAGHVARSGNHGDPTLYAASLPEFLGRPNDRLSSFDNPTKDPGCPCREYGAFILAQFLAENLVQGANGDPVYTPNIIRETWEELSDDLPPQLVEPALEAVVARYGTSLREIVPEFAYANYLLSYGSATGLANPSEADAVWRPWLDLTAETTADDVGPARPLRERRSLAVGETIEGAHVVAAGGAVYVDLVPPALAGPGEIAITIGGAIEQRLHARVATLDYPSPPDEPTVCIETPIFIDAEGDGSVSVPLHADCRYAVLIFSGLEVQGGTPIEFGWSANFHGGDRQHVRDLQPSRRGELGSVGARWHVDAPRRRILGC